jgi:hypothetical protein
MMPPRRKLRCAIYTRKSTEHNLDLEFNSLDAQREACEAYIKSQAHEVSKGLASFGSCQSIGARFRTPNFTIRQRDWAAYSSSFPVEGIGQSKRQLPCR